MEKDPIQRLEEITKDLHDSVGKLTQPVLKRYPLLFAFLLTFSAAAIIHGFNLLMDRVELFNTHPTLLILIGVIALTFTGTLYKTLQKRA